MFKKVICIVALSLMLSIPAMASDPYITGDTVYFGTNPYYRTFNSVINYIRFINSSTTRDCKVDLICRDSNEKTGYTTLTKAFVIVPACGNVSPNTIEINITTRNIAFISNVNDNPETDTITFWATGSRKLDN